MVKLNKDFYLKHKLAIVICIVIVLLGSISVLFSYAYFQVVDETPIIGGKVGLIPDFDIKIMAQNKDEAGNIIDGYSRYPYIPKAGYVYNKEKSYCVNGSVIDFDNETFETTITADKYDLCYMYFDATNNSDVILNVYAEDVDSNGKGLNTYSKLDISDLPIVNYELNTDKSSCQYGSEIAYDSKENLISVDFGRKDICNVYMDSRDLSSDISLKLFVQARSGDTNYLEVKEVPSGKSYVLNTSKSSCDGDGSLVYENGTVSVEANGKVACQAYLDLG